MPTKSCKQAVHCLQRHKYSRRVTISATYCQFYVCLLGIYALVDHTMSASLDLRHLSSEEKTARIQAIAKEITATFIALSSQKADGILSAEHVAPIHDIIRTITQTNGQQREDLERKISRYRRYAVQSRKEKLWMRRQFLVLMHRSEMVQRRWRERVNRLQSEMEKMRREFSSRTALDPERRCQKEVEDSRQDDVRRG